MRTISDVPEVSPLQLARALESGDPLQVVDIRSPVRVAAGWIDMVPAGRFHNIPGTEVMALASLDGTGIDPAMPVVVVCGHGVDSAAVAPQLTGLGCRASSLRGGMAAWVTAIFLAHYFLMIIIMCRVRAQLGPPSHQFYGAMPNWVLPTVLGTGAMGPRTMGMFTMLRPLLLEQRNHPVPNQIEGLKMAEGGRMERRRLSLLMAAIPVLALLAFFWATLHTGYHLGMASGHTVAWYTRIGGWATEELRSSIENPSGTDVGGTIAIVVSLIVTSVLYYLKLQFAWWPLHPVAYPISTSNTIAGIAPALFLTWLIKSLLLRYGGLRAHRTALPLFLGLLAGDATVALLREIVFSVVGKRV